MVGGRWDRLHLRKTTVTGKATFRYRALRGNDEIRLVEILNADSKDLVRISLRTVRLSKAPAFTMVSHALDLPTRTATVICNGRTLAVPGPLVDMLASLHQNRNNAHPKYLWISAVCIDHPDSADQGRIGLLRRDVSRKAQVTLIWTAGCLSQQTSHLLSRIASYVPTVPRSRSFSEGVAFLEDCVSIKAPAAAVQHVKCNADAQVTDDDSGSLEQSQQSGQHKTPSMDDVMEDPFTEISQLLDARCFAEYVLSLSAYHVSMHWQLMIPQSTGAIRRCIRARCVLTLLEPRHRIWKLL